MLKFWELAPSPNNTKVRMALRFKDVPFEAVAVDPMDRTAVREVSGQDLAPVIEDRGVVLNDSEAILQYLDANYRDAPRLFPRTREACRACDAWKQRLDADFARNWVGVFFYILRRRESFSEAERDRFVDNLRLLQDELGEADTFSTDAPIQDLRVAQWATYALPSAELEARLPLFRRSRELFGVEAGELPGLERFLAPWNARLV